jgi:uncharacterized protein (TIGR02757 family)
MQEIKDFLDMKVNQYNNSTFIEDDPVSIPHAFSRKEDIEIAGFFAATFAWGNRKSIVKTAFRLMQWMDNAPFDFIMNAGQNEIERLNNFKYRTFDGTDCQFFVHSLRNIYAEHHGLEQVFLKGFQQNQLIKEAIETFKDVFFEIPHPMRTTKHVANPATGSAAKRINMFLRWMVRNDAHGVDFGIWNQIPMSALMIPLDLHCGNTARQLGLMQRTQNDWKAVEELTAQLRIFDPADPVKYDFALFGMGVNKDGVL